MCATPRVAGKPSPSRGCGKSIAPGTLSLGYRPSLSRTLRLAATAAQTSVVVDEPAYPHLPITPRIGAGSWPEGRGLREKGPRLFWPSTSGKTSSRK